MLRLLPAHAHVPTHMQHTTCANWYKCPDFSATLAALIKHGADKSANTFNSDCLWLPIHFVAANAGHAGSAAAMELLVVEHEIDADTLTEDEQQPQCTPAWLVARHACENSSSRGSKDTTEYTLECLQQLLQLRADLHTADRGGLLYAAVRCCC
jgi:hypothetical protein